MQKLNHFNLNRIYSLKTFFFVCFFVFVFFVGGGGRNNLLQIAKTVCFYTSNCFIWITYWKRRIFFYQEISSVVFLHYNFFPRITNLTHQTIKKFGWKDLLCAVYFLFFLFKLTLVQLHATLSGQKLQQYQDIKIFLEEFHESKPESLFYDVIVKS